MKRWSLFLFLFLAGLGILWWIDRGRKRGLPVPEPSPTQTGPAGQGPLTPVQLGKDKQGLLGSEGPFLINGFDKDSGNLQYRVTAEDTKSLGDGIQGFEKLVVRFFVDGTDRVRLELKAEHARGRLSPLAMDFDRNYPVEMDDVVATLLEGSPFVPLTMKVPHAKGVYADETFTSTDPVDISGTGLNADGVGLSFDGKKRELRLEHETHVSLTLEDGTPATLSSADGISFTGLEKLGEGANRVVAKGKAHLTYGGKSPVVVDADTIELDALVERKPATRVRPKKVSAHGSVRLAPVDCAFFGDDADLVLGEDGRPEEATLTGSPRVELLLRGVDTSAVPGNVGQKPADLEVRMVGAGPLAVKLTGNAHFDFRGPATLMLPSLGVTLTAQEKLSGTRLEGSEFARLDATGNVEAHWGKLVDGALETNESTLTSDALAIERKLTKDGQIAAGLTSPGPTHAVGTLDDGSTFDLTAKSGLEFVRFAKSFQLPLARDVDLAVTGREGFVAKAREVRDLDSATRAFVGIGDVVFDSVKGRGRGQRIVSHGKDSAVLIGAPTAPAHCDLEQGWLEAREITYDVDRLRAEGEAHAVVGLEGTRYDVSARWASVQRKPAGDGEELVLEAGGDVSAHVDDKTRKLDLTAAAIEARASSPGKKLEHLESQGLVARDRVVFHVSGEQELSGEGDRLVFEPDRSGSLHPVDGERVHLWGRLPKDDLEFDMTAGLVSFSRTSLSATNPVIDLVGVDVPLGKAHSAGAVPLRAISGSMSVDPGSILFTEGVYFGQETTPDASWSLDAQKLVLLGSRNREPGPDQPQFTVSTVLAWGGFQAGFGQGLTARGDSLLLDHDRNRLTIRGDPAEFDNDGQRLSTGWLEVELDTGFVRASKGTWIPLDERRDPFEISFESMEPLYGFGSRVQVVREFSYTDAKRHGQTRAAWALLWLDEARLQQVAAKLKPTSELGVLELPPPPPPSPASPSSRNFFMQKLLTGRGGGWIRELYLEGNLEISVRGERLIRADSAYMNLVEAHGWVRDVDIAMDNPMRAEVKRLRLHADWIRCYPDGSAGAGNAVLTSCEFEEPHYEFTIGDLRMKPRPSAKARKAIKAGRTEGADDTDGYVVSSKHNSVRIGKLPSVPLGPITFLADDEFHIDPESISYLGIPLITIGSSARYGLYIGLSFALPLEWLSKRIGRALGDSTTQAKSGAPSEISQSNPAIVKYLNKRGLLLAMRNKVSQKGVFKVVSELDLIFDTGRDHGLIRVPSDERDSLRGWLHIEGRRMLGDTEWIDLRLTKQSDPGVQSEFFEHDFFRWEERETYLHWRSARGLDYSRATLEVQLDDRTEVLEMPSIGYTRARGPTTRWWHRDLLYGSDTTVAHLMRREGDLRLDASGNLIIADPFGVPILDGFGEEEALRLDSTHRWELPVPLGLLDARLVPFVEARATAWDRGATEASAPSRFALLAGAEISTTFWRLYSDSDLHSLTPTVGVHGDVDVEQSGPVPAQFDGVEDPIDGRFIDVGLRSRWVKPGDPSRPEIEGRWLDIEVRDTYAMNLSGGRDEGWLPLRVSAQWFSEVFNMPFGTTHEARYDVETMDPVYSRTVFAVRPVKSVEIETGFHTAQDLLGGSLYSVWSLGARYTFSPKWQFQATESVSSSSGNQLGSGFLLRRMGHDFVVELEYSFTAGEGGSSIGFKLIPMVGYRQSRFSQLSSWEKQGD